LVNTVPYLILSLDFELFWGVRDKRALRNYSVNLGGVYDVIPKLLQLFKQYHVHATWASVGFLFNESIESLKKNLPHSSLNYKTTKLNPYIAIDELKPNINEQKFYLASSLIKMINDFEGQEIASHTYSHYYCLEDGQTIRDFNNDLVLAKKVAQNLGINLKSIVFPRNQINSQYLQVCVNHGFTSYRGTELSKLYKARSEEELSIIHRLLKFIDSYINLSGHHTYSIDEVEKNGMINLRASSFFRPYHKRLSFFERFKLNRIKNSMSYAAKNNHIYHLWWHPHNFGINQGKNLNNLKNILEHFSFLRDKYGMESKNMNEVVKILWQRK